MTGPGSELATPRDPDGPDTRHGPARGTLAEELFPVLHPGGDWTLHRVRAALADLDDPHLQIPAIHVGGTNGKGSVATLMARILTSEGHRTALYTSPHLESVAERFRIDGRSVGDELLLAAARWVRPVVERHDLTFFEAVTVLAFDLFRSQAVDVSVLEVGLGGRLDATNVVMPMVSVVTNVALDHSEYLGATLEEIAAEKAGIAKPDVPFLTGEPDAAIREVLRDASEERGARFHGPAVPEEPDPDPRSSRPPIVEVLERRPDGLTLRMTTERWGIFDLPTGLFGDHQVRNVALALHALQHLPDEWVPSAVAVREGLDGVRLPGRLELRRESGRTVVFDVAHNPAASRVLARALAELDLPRPRVLLFGCLADKDWRGMLAPLQEWADHVVLTPVASTGPRASWSPREALAHGGEGGGSRSWTSAPDPGTALDEALDRSDGGTLLVTGSHRLVGAVRSVSP